MTIKFQYRFLSSIHNVEEKISISERNNLESEKKMLNYSKEYITGMRDLMTQNQQKSEIEIRALKSIVEANIARIDSKFEDTLKVVDDSINEVKAIHSEVRSQYNDLDGFMRENFDGIENKLVYYNNETEKTKDKITKISQTIKLLINENISLVETKIQEAIKNSDFKNLKYIEDLNENMRTLSTKIENVLQVMINN